MVKRAPFVFLAISLLSLSPVATAQEESRPASKPKRPDIYDTKTDGNVLVQAALKKAAAEDKRVLLVFGGNWCGWCHKLHDLFKKNADVATVLRNEYEPAWIDVGKGDRNQELAKGYVEKMTGVPFLVVLDSAGKVVTTQETDPLEDGDHHDPAKVIAFLEKWQVPAQDAEKVLADGLARAKSESKMVFLHFGAPWCGWCHKLEGFLARDEIQSILANDFVLVKIDEDRMTHGKDVEKKVRGEMKGGIPWIAFLDTAGEKLATSDAPPPMGNIGCPWKPEEIDWFMGMLKKVQKRITADQLKQLETSLRAYASEKPASRPQRM